MRNIGYVMLSVCLSVMSSCSRGDNGHCAGIAPVQADNISNQFVYSIAEDASGQIWIGTFRGLNRFNSRDYIQYFSGNDSLSLSDNQIRKILRSRSGELYVATVQGVNRRSDNDDFRTLDLGGRYLVSDMAELSDSTLLIKGNSKLISYTPADNNARVLLDDLCPGTMFQSQLHVSDNDELWIVGDNAVRRYDFGSGMLADSIPTSVFCSMSFLVGGSEIWLAGDRLTRFDTRRRCFVPLPDAISRHPVLSRAGIELVHPCGEHAMLLLTSADGMYYYDTRDGIITGQYETGFPISVPDFKIKTIFTDSRGNIWFGGHDQGVAVHYHYTERFNHNKYVRTAVDGKSVVSTAIDRDNNLWMATRNDGIFVHDIKNKIIRQFAISGLTHNPNAYDESIKDVFVDSRGNIWLTLRNAEILCCRYDGMRLVVDRRHYVWGAISLAEDSAGNIWVGTGSCYVLYLEPGADGFKPLQVFDPSFMFIPTVIPYDENNIAVAAFNQPVKLVNIHTREVRPLPVAHDSFDRMQRRSLFIPTDLCLDGHGNLWVATVANGLLKYNMADSTFTAMEGTASTDISAIQQDREGNMWVSTLDGISRYNNDTGTFVSFYARDGIGGNQFYDRAASIDHDGNIYFGGTHGITSFNPGELNEKVSAPLVFQNLIVHNKPVRPGSGIIDRALEFKPDVHLAHDNNSFGISFVAVDYCANPRVTYRYKMDGIDKSWIVVSDTREAYYANVAPGTYTFHVGIAGDDDSLISIRIVIERPWWTSLWAILAYCVFFAAIVGMLILAVMKFRAERDAVRRARQEKEREQHINDMNMRFFANISHEFRTPLTMISGPVRQVADSKGLNDTERHLLAIAKVNVNRMLNLVNQLLDFNKLENDTLPLEVERMDIAGLLRQITDMFATHAAGKEIRFFTSGLEDNCFITADADKLNKIINNLFSNALKFTPRGGSITVGLDTVNDAAIGEAIKIYVRNTGSRIPSDKLETIFERYYQLDGLSTNGSYNCGSGIGLYYSRALAVLHHGRLFAVDTPGFAGAEFDLLLPVSPEVYANDKHKGAPTQFDAYPLSAPPGGVSPVGADTVHDPGRPLVLVVDDDIQVAEYLRTLLSVNYTVVSRFDAESALEWLDENIPALIISDVVMPGKDGYDLCRTVKRDIRFSHIPVILLTAKATVENQVEGLEAEADAYITKPFDPTLLLSQIGSLLRNREKAQHMITAGTTVNDVEADIISSQDSTFLAELYGLMENELGNCELDVNEIARLMRMSRTKFYYKIKGLTGEPPSAFFKTYKLNRAAELIREHKYTLSEISDMTGFSSLSHFSRSFKKQFGVAPTAYR